VCARALEGAAWQHAAAQLSALLPGPRPYSALPCSRRLIAPVRAFYCLRLFDNLVVTLRLDPGVRTRLLESGSPMAHARAQSGLSDDFDSWDAHWSDIGCVRTYTICPRRRILTNSPARRGAHRRSPHAGRHPRRRSPKTPSSSRPTGDSGTARLVAHRAPRTPRATRSTGCTRPRPNARAGALSARSPAGAARSCPDSTRRSCGSCSRSPGWGLVL
jgi:hypothetical protein